MWAYLKPDQAKPPKPTATVNVATTAAGELEWEAANRKIVWVINPEHVNNFRTYKIHRNTTSKYFYI